MNCLIEEVVCEARWCVDDAVSEGLRDSTEAVDGVFEFSSGVLWKGI